MKCPRCNGKRCEPDNSGDLVWRACKMCNGTGIVPDNNENWFCTLSTEEKAKFFHGIVIRAMHATWDGKKPDYPAYLSDWKKWLKEEHHGN